MTENHRGRWAPPVISSCMRACVYACAYVHAHARTRARACVCVCVCPGEIKRREVSWTLTKKTFICVSRRDQEEGGGAGPSREPMRDQDQGGGAGFRNLVSFASLLLQQLCYKHCLCESAPHSS